MAWERAKGYAIRVMINRALKQTRLGVLTSPLLLILAALFSIGCAGQASQLPPPVGSKAVRFGHVFIVVEENANYSDVISNPAMP